MEAKQIRQKARENLAPNWGLSIGVAAVAALLGGLMAGSSFLPNLDVDVGKRIFGSWNWEIIEGFRISFSNGILGFAAFIIGGVLALGYLWKDLLPLRKSRLLSFGSTRPELNNQKSEGQIHPRWTVRRQVR